jgi:hydroxymethylglutaryl-CoA lyase
MMTDRARVREVGPRDGLQLVKKVLGTEQKLEWCRRAAAAGVSEIEVTSFVPAKVVAQFADAEAVACGAVAMGGFAAAALAPNLRGAERAFATGVSKVNYVLSASEEHNLANVRRSTQASVDDFVRVVRRRDEVAKGRVKIGGGIATAFGCTIAGAVPEERVVALAATLAEAGADEIIVADTVGYANPRQVERLIAPSRGRPAACPWSATSTTRAASDWPTW